LGDISYGISKIKFAGVRCEASVVYPFKQANPCNHRIVCSSYKKLLEWMVWSAMKNRLFFSCSWCWSSKLERGDANMWIPLEVYLIISLLVTWRGVRPHLTIFLVTPKGLMLQCVQWSGCGCCVATDDIPALHDSVPH